MQRYRIAFVLQREGNVKSDSNTYKNLLHFIDIDRMQATMCLAHFEFMFRIQKNINNYLKERKGEA